MWDQEIIYFAGYLDGEGCFTLTGKVPQGKGSPCVMVSACYKKVLYDLSRRYGGPIKEMKRYSRKHRPAYRWHVTGANAVYVCKELLPFLKEKKEQAELIIKHSETGDYRGKEVPPDTLKQRIEIASNLKELKHV